MAKTQNAQREKLNKKLEQIIKRTKSQNRFLKNLLLEIEEDAQASKKTKEKDSDETK